LKALANDADTTRRTAWIFSFTPVARSPRVLRQAQALHAAGWQVVVLGYLSVTPCPAEWHFVPLPQVADSDWIELAVMRALRFLGIAMARYGPFPTLRQAGARLYYRAIPHYRRIGKIAEKLGKDRSDLAADLVIGHDYFTANVGYRIARKYGAKFSIDCHEHSRSEYMDDPQWVARVRPLVVALQDFYLARADAVTTVCEGIAQLLDAEQVLKRPAAVVRSVPFSDPQPFRPTGSSIVVLYHGQIFPSRDLEIAVRSLPMWRAEFSLLLRGYADAQYADHLKALARELGVDQRLRIEPPVSFEEIVSSANEADIGYFVHQDKGPQQRFVLPNKFFEYVMAGLALCVSDLPEMARLVKLHGLGVLVSKCDTYEVARAVNSLDRKGIDTMKRNSIAAALILNWESEQQHILNVYEELFQ
jgi:glycosyltransferase involved in cell wall biosynthesis